jgi:4-hydroxy-3-methylbut-2-enyl diphosphate reductase
MDPDLGVDDPPEQPPAPQAIVLLAPRRSDARALRRGLAGQGEAVVVHTGVGPRRSRKAAQLITGKAVAVAGVGRALADRVRPGDVVVADQVRTDALTEGMVPPTRIVPSAPRIAAMLREKGLTVHVGMLISTDNRVYDTVRDRLAMTRALIADRESAWLLAACGKRPIACVRVAANRSLLEWRRTSRTLRIISATLIEWAS